MVNLFEIFFRCLRIEFDTLSLTEWLVLLTMKKKGKPLIKEILYLKLNIANVDTQTLS